MRAYREKVLPLYLQAHNRCQCGALTSPEYPSSVNAPPDHVSSADRMTARLSCGFVVLFAVTTMGETRANSVEIWGARVVPSPKGFVDGPQTNNKDSRDGATEDTPDTAGSFAPQILASHPISLMMSIPDGAQNDRPSAYGHFATGPLRDLVRPVPPIRRISLASGPGRQDALSPA